MLWLLLLWAWIASAASSEDWFRNWLLSHEVDLRLLHTFAKEEETMEGIQSLVWVDDTPGVLLSIPTALTLHPDSVPEYKPLTVELDPQRVLVLTLVLERQKGNESFWFPYLNQLPAQYNTPEYWSSEELSELQSPPLEEHFASELEWWHTFHSEAEAALGRPIPFAEYAWATSTVQARIFGVSDTLGLVLIPLVDQFRYHVHSTCEIQHVTSHNQSLVQVVATSLQPGQEIYLPSTLDSASNLNSLSKHGRILLNNVHNTEQVKHGVLHSQPQPQELASMYASAQACVESIQTELDAAPTSLEQDQELLLGLGLGNQRTALLFRSERKQTLRRNLAYCQSSSSSNWPTSNHDQEL
ncbi:hypothetical protein BASA81_004778 [Batrachochytrium salamandrivorans]|nr:hypothetical protein BASA81_004778 [Batrachochytrium salamandrivorans]